MQFQPSKRPRLLKDFLQDDTNSTTRLRQPKSTKNRSAFQAILNALLKNISSAAVKSPSILPRSLSRKQKSTNITERDGGEIQIITVRVKDIMRWKSFRDLVEVEERSPPSDPSLTTTSGSCSSRGSSWCDSDFTSEYLPDEEEEEGKSKTVLPCVGRNWVGPEANVACEEEEQYSSLSVLSRRFMDDEDSFSHFHFYDQTRNDNCEDENVALEWGLLGHNKELCIREMEKGGRWSKFQEEQQEVCLEIEKRLFGSMINEILRDLLSC